MKSLRRIVCVLALLKAIFAMSLCVFAKGSYAKISDIRGDVMIKKSGGKKTFKAKKNMKLSEKDTVITGENGSVIVVFENGNQSIIGKNSKLKFDEMKKVAKKEYKISLNLKSGDLFNNVKNKLKKNESFKVKTPNAIAGVRGTQFYVRVKKLAYFGVTEGRVWIVATKKGGKQTVLDEDNAVSIDGLGKLKDIDIEELIYQENFASEFDLIGNNSDYGFENNDKSKDKDNSKNTDNNQNDSTKGNSQNNYSNEDPTQKEQNSPNNYSNNDPTQGGQNNPNNNPSNTGQTYPINGGQSFPGNYPAGGQNTPTNGNQSNNGNTTTP